MARFSNEFLVGLLTLAVAVLVGWAVVRTDDKPDGASAAGYLLSMTVPTAEGIFPTTPVRMAGVGIGAVETVKLVGNEAIITLQMRGDVQLPTDSFGQLKGEGLLGDRYVRVSAGTATTLLHDGDTLRYQPDANDIEGMTNKVSDIADDVKAITAALRTFTEDPTTRDQIRSTVANLEALSAQLRELAGANGEQLAAIAQNLRTVSETLNEVVGATGSSVEQEMVAIRAATETLDRTIRNLESISAKVDEGEGTIGRLVNDTTTIDSINDTLAQVNDIVDDVSSIQTQVYYRGDVYYGTDPTSGAFDGNPVSGLTRNVLGLRLQPREDYWYVVEVVGHPIGNISHEDRYLPDLGTAYREYVVAPGYRFSFQFAKRFQDLVVRFGVKESSGGAGVDWLLVNDRVSVSADVYDFTYGSWPVMDGTPNVQLTARAWPWRHVYVEAGLDNVVLGARYRYVTGFAGGGFTFDDRDLKFVLAALPLP